MNNYETVFILNPVLSEDQMKDAVGSYEALLKEQGAEIVNVEKWGLENWLIQFSTSLLVSTT